MSLKGANDDEKLSELSSMTYKQQAVWFLNAYWEKYGDEHKEDVWMYANKLIELDERGAEGCDIDEFLAHRFLESVSETMTVRHMRETLKEIDIDFNKRVSMTEYLIFRFKVDWHRLVNASQASNNDEIEQAQALLVAAQAALAKARKAHDEATRLEEAQKVAEAELKKALAALEKEEELYETKKSTLEKKSQEGGIVSRNRAKNELEQLLAEDPLPLRRAKINQGAAVRKAEKATKAAAQAAILAEGAVKDAEAAFKKAEDFLEEVKTSGGSAEGGIWWLERELAEAKKYLPQKKGGVQGDAYWKA